MLDLIQKIFGSPNARKIKGLEPTLDIINRFEAELETLTDDQLRAKTEFFRNELANRPTDPDPGRDRKLEAEMLEMILPEAFAVVREASKRVLGMRHYDVQMIGGMILHRGNIAEMRTGEGKTLVATLPAYLNALTGKGVHVVTVNDYLAKRDAEWMGQLYTFLGLTVGTVLSEKRGENAFQDKKSAYAADITYGTNNEFGFDYLRDNMATTLAQMVQRPFNYAIIDEVDSILIDEARTPLIISGRMEQSADTYQTMARLAPKMLVNEHYTIDEKARNVILTEDGIDHAQALLGVEDLFDPKTYLAHHLISALKAKELFKLDSEYVVKDNQIVIVDEFTGRLMEGRRWSDGLHQAVEAKEGVPIQDEMQTLASITFQNLFRLYPKLSGMTGTAMTEEAEFGKIYNLEVTTIPTNRVDSRKDVGDIVYKTERIKFYKAVEDIIEWHQKGRPVLVGTTSIEKSEWIANLLKTPLELVTHLREKAQRLEQAAKPHEAFYAKLAPVLKNPETQRPETFRQLAEAPETPGDFREFLEGMAATANAVQQIRKGIPHQVLNAKQHEHEAYIVAQAGRFAALTIATNMAGRGTDIVLGGNPEFLARQALREKGLDKDAVSKADWDAMLSQMKAVTEAEKEKVVALGGLYIVGTERHESRRIDNQLRGRAARQGDPGSTRFYLSLEDSLMRIFGGQKVSQLMDVMNVDETMPISAGMVSSLIERAQHKVEAYHFETRKNILKYDDVLTEQRQLIYKQRRQVLEGFGLRDSMRHMIESSMARLVGAHFVPDTSADQRDPEIVKDFVAQLHQTIPQLSDSWTEERVSGLAFNELVNALQADAVAAHEELEALLLSASHQLRESHGLHLVGLENELDPYVAITFNALDDAEKAHYVHPLRRIERDILMSMIDAKWVDYLHCLDALRDGIGLRAYGQKDPLLEYKREAFEMFQALTYDIQDEAVALLFRARIEIEVDSPPLPTVYDSDATETDASLEPELA